MNIFTPTGEQLFIDLIKEFADEKIFPMEQYYRIDDCIVGIKISADEEDLFNQHFGLTSEEIIHKVEAICFSFGADQKLESEKTIKFFIGSEIVVIINK